MKRININRLITLVVILAIVLSSFCGVSLLLSVTADGDSPVYDAKKHTDISVGEALKGGKTDDGSFVYTVDDINYADFVNVVNTGVKEDATIYGSATLEAGTFATNAVWDGQYIALASATDWYGNYGYLALKFTQGDNVDIQLLDGSMVSLTYVGGHISALKPAYPNTGNSFGSETRQITYALSLTHFTLWVDGIKIVDNYEWLDSENGANAQPITIENFTVGAGAVNSKTRLSNYRVWTDNENVIEPVPTYVSAKHFDVTSGEEVELIKAKDGSYSVIQDTENYLFLKSHEKTRLTADAVIYGSAKVGVENFSNKDNTVSIIMAKTAQGNLALTLTAENGVEIWIIDESGNKLSSVYKASYNNSEVVFGSEMRKITYSISKNEISVWCGVDKIIDNLKWNSTSPATEIIDFVFGLLSKGDKINVSGYRVWGTKQHVKVVVPQYDSKLHIDISSRSEIDGSMSTDGSYSFLTTNNLYSQVKELGGVMLNDNATIYGSVTLSPSTIHMNQWGGVMLPIAKAKFRDQYEGKLFIKFTHGDRIDIQLETTAATEPIYIGGLYPVLKPTYPDGTASFGDTSHDVVYMINKTSFTLWVDGVKVIDNFVWDSISGGEIIINDYLLGIEAVNSTVNAQGYRVWVDKSEGKVTAPVYDKKKHYDVTAVLTLDGTRAENGSYTFESSNDFESVVKITSDNVSNIATLYGAVKYSNLNWENNGLLYINLGKAACGNISGDLQLVLTKDNGGYLRIKNDNKAYNLGESIPSVNIGYIDGNSFPKEDTTISYEINDEWLSVWIGDIQIFSDFKLKEAVDFKGDPSGIYLSSFAAGLGSQNVGLTASEYRVWSDIMYSPTPSFNAETDVNILTEMEAVTIGDGPIYENKDGNVTVGSSNVGDGDGTNSGVMFAGPVLKKGGTMYYQTVITTDTILDPTLVNAQIYGGPVIRLANAKFYTQQRTGGYNSGVGYLDIIFTQGDKIDFRIRDLTGYDEYYIGAYIPDFKMVYPDTYNSSRGDSEYEVTIALNDHKISMWINGKALLLDHQLFDLQGTSTDEENVLEIWDIAPGILYNLSKGTANEFKVWCSKEDYEPYELGEVTYPDTEPNEAFATESEIADVEASTKNDSSKEKR